METSTSASPWQQLARRIGMATEDVLERVTQRYHQRFRPDLPLHILPFGGFGTPESASVTGRVTRYKSPVLADPDTVWGALQHSYRRFDTHEEAGIRVSATVNGLTSEAVTDEEGYFTIQFRPPALAAGQQLSISLDLPEHLSQYSTSHTHVLIPPTSARFGVISDIDDTVLVTNATSIVHMMRLTLLQSSQSRLAFPGVAAFYNALHQGGNPFFYVSSSPWNLHEFLTDFFDINEVVGGPLLLRDYGIDETKFIAGSHRDHKLNANRRLFDTYPSLKFILIGDSGQEDPEIYSTLMEEYPERVLAIYIRDVSDDVRDAAVQSLMSRAAQQGVDMLLVPDTLAAARHAATQGFMDAAAMDAIAEAMREDQLPAVQV